VGLLFSAWASDRAGSSFLSGLLVEIGVTLFLLVPILTVTRRLEQRVVEAEDENRRQVSDLRQRVEDAEATIVRTASELSEAIGERARVERVRLEQVFEELESDTSREGVLRALAEGRKRGFTGRSGPRVSLPYTNLYIRFQLIGESLTLSLEAIDGKSVARHVWPKGQSTDDAFVAVAGILRREGMYPGDSAYRPGECFIELKRLLLTASRAEARGQSEVRDVIQIFGNQWVLTDENVVSVDPLYAISRKRLSESDWREHMHEKTWLEAQDFDAAMYTAEELARTKLG
jgi:hypothetical protein